MDDPVPADQHIDHSMMDHSMMDHSNMNHMNHMREMAPVEDEVTSQAVDHSMMVNTIAQYCKLKIPEILFHDVDRITIWTWVACPLPPPWT